MFRKITSFLFSSRPGKILLDSDSAENILKLFPVSKKSHPIITSLFSYRHPKVKQCIWEMKYHNNRDAYRLFAYALCSYIIRTYVKRPQQPHNQTVTSSVYITNIPISNRRRSEKGFDHIDQLCKTIEHMSAGKLIYIPLCKKIRHTKRQAHIKNRSTRKQNISGSFECIRKNIEALLLESKKVTSHFQNSDLKNESSQQIPIIIIDDVYTTGATMMELSQTIRSKEIQTIHQLTIAH